MISRLKFRGILAASVILLSVAFTGCKTPKNVAYFQDVTENVVTIPSGQASKIMPNDRLSIIVKTKDPSMTQLFNKSLPYDRIGEGYSDYFVSPEGTIDFPMLGELKVTGMTRDELAAFIKGELIGKGYIKEAIVSVDIINLGFSVLGEVNKPGFFGLIKEEMTLLEALSLAGDMT
ncbi:MAG: polysaccharide biosynthesis/export family protein, partial [Muribaculaceae bacterium]|nr:polysaccharide biosynthesis/export family protein [Muribaculaceae bacterium]